MAACTTGQTQVQGLPDVTGATGPTTATGPTGPTGETSPPDASGEAFSLVFDVPPEAVSGISEAAFFTCEGLEGTWRYIFKADLGIGLVFDIDSEVDMAGGEGTLVFGGQFDVLDVGSASFTETIDLRLLGTRAIKVTDVVIDIDSNIPGLTEDALQTFPKTGTLAIVEGSDRC